MGQLLRAAVVFAAVAGLTVASESSSAPAQVKGKDKKQPKKDDTARPQAKAGNVETVEVYQAKDGWRFRVRDAAGKSVAVGVDGYEKKEDCLKAVEGVKAVLNKGRVVELNADKK